MSDNISHCAHDEIRSTFDDQVSKMSQWLHQMDTKPVLLHSIVSYLLSQGSSPFTLPQNDPSLIPVGILVDQSCIVWDKFLHGFNARYIHLHQHHY